MPLDKNKALEIYHSMCRVRAFEEQLSLTHKKGLISGGVFTGKGHELINAVAASFLNKEDILGPTHRSMGSHFAKGISYLDMARQWMAKSTGGTRGKDNAAHLGSQELNVFGIISPLATMIPLMAGAVMVNQIRGEHRVALTYVGDGATSCADFHEGLALIAAQKLPVVIVIENNGYAYSTEVSKQTRRKNFADHGKIFAMNTAVIDGTDLEQTYACFEKAFEQVRANKGPYLIETKVWRMSGHSLADDCSYVTDSFKKEAIENDPVIRVQKYLLAQGETEHSVAQTLSDWVSQAKTVFEEVAAEPDADPSTVTEGVYAETMTI